MLNTYTLSKGFINQKINCTYDNKAAPKCFLGNGKPIRILSVLDLGMN